MNPENTLSTDDSAPPPAPPPYMPPIDETSPSIVAPAVDSTVASPKSSKTPAWVWIVIAVFVVVVIGSTGWSWYQINLMNTRDQSDYSDYNQQITAETNNSDTSNVNKCDQTPDANSVCIGNRIWMNKNLNEGVMINSSVPQTNNNVIEKYCYDNDPLKCDTYGGLYQWDEMMQYTTTEGNQGICPAGYHPPVDAEWRSLTDNLGYDMFAWSKTGIDGSSGFSNLFGGYFSQGADGKTLFTDMSKSSFYWYSTEYTISSSIISDARDIGVYAGYDGISVDINRGTMTKNYGLSVRCIKNLM